MAPSADVAQLQDELASLRARVEAAEAERERALAELRLAQAEHVDHKLLGRALDFARRIYGQGASTPVLRHFVSLGARVADVGVRRLTPWGSCAELNKHADSLVPYLDAQVLSPQLEASKASTRALCEPLYLAAKQAAQPYLEAFGRGRESLSVRLQPVMKVARPLIAQTTALVPAWACRRRVEELVEEAVEELVETLDEKAAVLDDADAERIFDAAEQVAERAREGAEQAASFVQEHRGEIEHTAQAALEAAKDLRQVEQSAEAALTATKDLREDLKDAVDRR